jgi:hypothetical protein
MRDQRDIWSGTLGQPTGPKQIALSWGICYFLGFSWGRQDVFEPFSVTGVHRAACTSPPVDSLAAPVEGCKVELERAERGGESLSPKWQRM